MKTFSDISRCHLLPHNSGKPFPEAPLLGESRTPMRRGGNRKERGSVGRGGIEGRPSVSSPPSRNRGWLRRTRADGRADGRACFRNGDRKDDDDGANHGSLLPSGFWSGGPPFGGGESTGRRRPSPDVGITGMEALPKIRSQSVSFPWPEGEEEDLLGISSKSSFEDAPATFAQDVLLRRGRERGQG